MAENGNTYADHTLRTDFDNETGVWEVFCPTCGYIAGWPYQQAEEQPDWLVQEQQGHLQDVARRVTPERLAAIRERIDGVEDLGAWTARRDEEKLKWMVDCGEYGPMFSTGYVGNRESKPIAEFAAHARQDLPDLLGEVERLREEEEGLDDLVGRQGDILTRAANALNGPPPELTTWSHHDLGEKAEDLVAERDRLRTALERVKELALADRKCPGCTGYDSIIATVEGAIK